MAFAIGAVKLKSVFPAVNDVPFNEPGLTFNIQFAEPPFLSSTLTLSINTFNAAFVELNETQNRNRVDIERIHDVTLRHILE